MELVRPTSSCFVQLKSRLARISERPGRLVIGREAIGFHENGLGSLAEGQKLFFVSRGGLGHGNRLFSVDARRGE